MAEYDVESYDLYRAIESVSLLIDGIAEAEPDYKHNQYLKQFNIDFDKLSSTYYDVLYSLCEIVVKQGKVDYIRDELEDDNVSDHNFNEIIEDIDYRAKETEHEDLIYSVKVGDKVRLYNGSEFYVHSIDGMDIWVTKRRDEDRGWAYRLDDIIEIVEKGDEGF